MKTLILLGLWAATTAVAAPITYNVTVNTSSLAGTAGTLYFQFNPGDLSSDAAMATLSLFQFTGGGTLSGLPSVSGDTTGSLSSSLILRNTADNNDALQALTFGSSFQFRLLLSGTLLTNPSSTALTGSVFNFGLFGTDGITPLLTTNTDGYALTVNLNTRGMATTTTYPASANTGSPVSVSAVNAVPEPNTLLLTGAAGIVLLCALRRRAVA